MKWFRLYDEILDDPKMMGLSAKEFQTWILLLCLANRETAGKRGEICRDFATISRQIHGENRTISQILKRFMELGLIRLNGDSIQIVNWDKRQFKSDDVLQRVKRYRNVTVTSPDTDTDTDTEKHTPIVPKGDNSFDLFWKQYPRKVGKGAAQKAWKKIQSPNTTLDSILAALKWQKKSEQWTKDLGQFIPHPATYLNQKRWEDEPDKTSQIRSGANEMYCRVCLKRTHAIVDGVCWECRDGQSKP